VYVKQRQAVYQGVLSCPSPRLREGVNIRSERVPAKHSTLGWPGGTAGVKDEGSVDVGAAGRRTGRAKTTTQVDWLGFGSQEKSCT
jgi:hypothetical protein